VLVEQVSSSWEEWKQQLAQAVKIGESMNMSREQMAKRAEAIGDFLAQRVDPRNPEQKVLQELWQAADQDEQQAIAGAMIKLVSGQEVH